MEKNRIIILLHFVFLLPIICYSQKIELKNGNSDLMSLPYFYEDNNKSKPVLDIKQLWFAEKRDFFTYKLNALSWLYNDKNQLWIEAECLDWSTAECCDCSPTKIATGWINSESIKNGSLFSEFLKPFTLKMITENNFQFKDTLRKIAYPKEGFTATGFGGTLMIYDYNFLHININGKIKRLEKYDPSKYPNRENNDFTPYAYFYSDYVDIKIRLFYENHTQPYIEILENNKVERILLNSVDWVEYEYY